MKSTDVSKRRWRRLIAAVVAAGVVLSIAQSNGTDRAAADGPSGPGIGVLDPAGAVTAADRVPEIEARAYAVYDAETGEFLAARDLHGRRAVGSLMKLLTARVVIEAGSLDHEVTIPSLSTRSDESAIGLRTGEKQRRDVLLRAMLIVSANDAARALAIDVGGDTDAFVERMNTTALNVGMKETHAVDPAGLDAHAQYSSAHDLVLLGDLLMRDEPFREIVARRNARLHDRVHPATNDLLGVYLGADGVKTGYTDQAGWCLLSSATRDDRRIFAIVLGSPSEAARDRDASRLLDWGFAVTNPR